MKNLILIKIVSLFIQVNNLRSQDKPVDCDFLVSCLNSKIVAFKTQIDENIHYLDLSKGTIISDDNNSKNEIKADYYKHFVKGSFSSKGKTEYLLFLCFRDYEVLTKFDGFGVCLVFLLDDKFKQTKGPVEIPYRIEEEDSIKSYSDKFIRKNLKEPDKFDIDGDGKDEFYFEGPSYNVMGYSEKQLFVYSGNFDTLLFEPIFIWNRIAMNMINYYIVDYSFEKSKVIFNSKVEKYLIISDEEERLAFKGEYYDEYILIDGKFIHKPDKRNFKEIDLE